MGCGFDSCRWLHRVRAPGSPAEPGVLLPAAGIEPGCGRGAEETAEPFAGAARKGPQGPQRTEGGEAARRFLSLAPLGPSARFPRGAGRFAARSSGPPSIFQRGKEGCDVWTIWQSHMPYATKTAPK